jgi:NADH:ubiquinone oxidoreductase subunit K
MIPLSWYLILSGLLFLIGLLSVLIRKNSIGILMGIELILNATNINLLAFWRYLYAQNGDHSGQMFVIIVFVVAAAEAAVGLAMIISAYRRKNTIVANDIDELKG